MEAKAVVCSSNLEDTRFRECEYVSVLNDRLCHADEMIVHRASHNGVVNHGVHFAPKAFGAPTNFDVIAHLGSRLPNQTRCRCVHVRSGILQRREGRRLRWSNHHWTAGDAQSIIWVQCL